MAFNLTLRKSFLYIFATVGLVISIIGAISLIDLGLKKYVFTQANNSCIYSYPAPIDKDGNPTTDQAQQDQYKRQCEEQQATNNASQASNAIAMLIIGIPLYTYHWYRIHAEKQI
jgi:hypothetical protein